MGYFSYFLGSTGALLTAFYSTRLLYFTFLSKPAGFKQIIYYANDSGIQICLVLGCLTIPSIFAGYYTKDMIVGVGRCAVTLIILLYNSLVIYAFIFYFMREHS